MDIGETAKAAQFFLADGVILTGTSTGKLLTTKGHLKMTSRIDPNSYGLGQKVYKSQNPILDKIGFHSKHLIM